MAANDRIQLFPSLVLVAVMCDTVILLSCRKGGFFVDLFVRVSNQVAVNMYKRLGYSVYRTVIEYYSASNGEPDEDAYGKTAHQRLGLGINTSVFDLMWIEFTTGGQDLSLVLKHFGQLLITNWGVAKRGRSSHYFLLSVIQLKDIWK